MDQTLTARLFLDRFGFGPSEATPVGLIANNPYQWLEDQLVAGSGDDLTTQAKLGSVVLPIKYDAKDTLWPAVDQQRPLVLLDRPIEQVWHLADGGKSPGQERGQARDEVAAATITRAVWSQAQLREVMADFWHNHFNVNAAQGDAVSIALPSYDRDVIRTHSLGNFRKLLEAVGSHAAMLIYLDNRSSRAGEANENYGRELFELHTLGADHYLNALYDKWKDVPGAARGAPVGYIDGDVYEAARSFTGWAIEDGTNLGGGQSLPQSGKFVYVDAWHDNYQKRVLATDFDPNAPPMSDGHKVFDLLAAHPGTAEYICTKLCRRLVSDTPPPALVAKAAKTWMEKRNSPDQIAQVIRTIALSPEFLMAPPQKIKRPLELVASFVRALGLDFTVTIGLLRALDGSGQKLFGWGPPSGHPDVSSYWLGTNGLRQRVGLLLGIAQNAWGTGVFNPAQGLPPGADAQTAAKIFLGRMMPPQDAVAWSVPLLQGLNWMPQKPVPADGKDHQDSLRKLAAYAALTPPFQVR